MSTESSIVTAETYRSRQELAASPSPSAIEESQLLAVIARAASDPHIDLDKMQRLFEMREKLLAREAEQQFNDALAQFKKVAPAVTKDMKNTQYTSTYTSLGNLVNTINPILGEYGLSADWEIDQTDKIKVTCVLRHVGGHSRRVSLCAGPDTSGAKNPIQQIKSTVTYLEVATFQAVTGIAAAGANTDDDGNNAGGQNAEFITAEQVAYIRKLAEEVGADKDKFLATLKVERLEEVPAASYSMVVGLLEAKRNARPRNAA